MLRNLTINTRKQSFLSIQSMGVEDDFFATMYSNHVLNQFMFTMVIIGTTFGLLLMSGIIWYEKYGNHRCRTAINQLFSTLAWVVIGYIILVYLPEGIRYLQGPLDESFCCFHNFMKNFLPSCFLLTMDCIIIMRYIFIFRLSNFAVVKDDLIVRFLNLCIVVLSIWISVVKRITSGMPLNYHMCAGSNPNANQENTDEIHTNGKFNTIQILLFLSLLLHFFALTKIFLYEREMEKKIRNINLGTIKSSRPDNIPQCRVAWTAENKFERLPNLSKSMVDFTTQMLCLVFMAIFQYLNHEKNTTKSDELNEKRNRWYAYSQQAGVTFAIGGISLLYYGRNKYIARTIWRRIVELFRH